MAGTETVIFLFTDLAESTAQEAAAGSAAWDRVRAAHFAALRAALARHGGVEVKTIGDALMATFTSAVEAVACAVSMQQEAAANRRDGTALGLRVGISAGEAVEQDGDWFGLPVVEASRLCAAATPGQVLVADVVRHLGRGRSTAAFSSVGPLALKGLPEAVDASEVAWEDLRAPTIPLPPRLATPARSALVGRDDAVASLRKAWDAAAAGERRVVMLAGEPGIGKTRLATELAKEVHEAGGVVLFGHCDEDVGAPYQPFVQALRHYVTSTPAGDLRARLGPRARDLVRVLPELAELVPGLEPPTRADPEAERYAVLEAVADVVGRAAALSPVLLVLDDVHWADRPSLVLLRHLARADPASVLILGTYRDTELGRTHPLAETLADLRRERVVERVDVQGLGRGAVAALIGGWAGAAVPEEFAAAIHEETEGNPFFVEEVLLHLVESGAVRYENGHWTAATPIAELSIPEGVREVVGRRLSRLPVEAADVLSVASVVGRDFSVDLLEQCSAAAPDVILDALDAAAAAGLVREIGGTVGQYAFSHALVRQTLYEELSNVRRTRLHWKVGTVLEQADATAAAHHLIEGALAGDGGRAVNAALKAARAALLARAMDQADTWHRRAEALAAQLGLEDPVLRCDVAIVRGEIELMRASAATSEPAFRQAIALAREIGDNERLVAAVEGFAFLFRSAFDPELDRLFTDTIASLPPEATTLRLRLATMHDTHRTTWFG